EHPLSPRGGEGTRAGRTAPGARPLPARSPGPVRRQGQRERGRCPAPRPRPRRPPAAPRPPGPARPGTFDHVAVDGGAELLARALVEVLPVDDPHLLQEGGLAALARAQQQDLHQPLHVGLLPGQAFVDLLGLALLFGLAARQHAAGEAHGQHGPRRQEVRHLAAAAAAASAGPSGSLHLLLGRRAAPAPRLEGGERCGGPSVPGEGGNERLTRRAGRPSGEGGKEGGPGRGGGPRGVRALAASRGRARTPRLLSRLPRRAGQSRSNSRARGRRRGRAGRGRWQWSRGFCPGRARA
uniref:Uncharacterized protein n=1 Tax=Equus asinus TaxID=9793 RepID=A0A9L0IUJ6_EQUAS